MQYYLVARGAPPPPQTPLLEVAVAQKTLSKRVSKNASQNRYLFGVPVGDSGDQKRSIVANLAPKITPKWSPKWSRGNNGRSSRNMRRHERIACPPPPGSSVFAHFPTPEKYRQKINIITPICEPGSKMTPKVPLQAPRQETQIHKKTPLQKGIYLGALLATRPAQKEYSGELGSQNDSKMESKMEPKQQRPILTKHAPA